LHSSRNVYRIGQRKRLSPTLLLIEGHKTVND
jgi:hypothetical protein